MDMQYHRATSVSHALRLKEQSGEGSFFYAGGTDLVPALRAKAINPKTIIYLGSIEELKSLANEGEFIRIGSLVTHETLASSPVINEHLPSLMDACASIGSPQTRNLGTIGGNLCWASPAADTAPVLLVHDARIRVVSLKGEREIPIQEFFLKPNQTVLAPGELLAEILVQKPKGPWASSFMKIGRRKALAISVVNSTVLLMEGGSRAHIALGSAGPIPFRASRAEKEWQQIWETNNPDIASHVGKTAAGETKPITDSRAPGWYRRRVAGVIVERALRRCLSSLKSR
jgi:carbon-monoxide dehydrogenase medium subunit